MVIFLCISNCRIVGLIVGGGDTAHGGLPRLVSPPTGDNLECTVLSSSYDLIALSYCGARGMV